jgi:hypothetical protein
LELAGAGVTWGHINDQPQTIVGLKTFSSELIANGGIKFPGTASLAGQFAERFIGSRLTWTVNASSFADSATFSTITITQGLWLFNMLLAVRGACPDNVLVWLSNSAGATLFNAGRIPPQGPAGNGDNDNQYTSFSELVPVSSNISFDRFRAYNYGGSSRIISAAIQIFRIL